MEKEEKLHEWLARQGKKWHFNLSRAPWWGGQFERLVGLMKQSLYKTIGNGNLLWKELQEVILDVEITLKNRPLMLISGNAQGTFSSAKKPYGEDGLESMSELSTSWAAQHYLWNQRNGYKGRRCRACQIRRTKWRQMEARSTGNPDRS